MASWPIRTYYGGLTKLLSKNLKKSIKQKTWLKLFDLRLILTLETLDYNLSLDFFISVITQDKCAKY